MGRIRTDQAPFRTKYDPGHPSADDKGDVKLPNVNCSSRPSTCGRRSVYEANLNLITATRRMISRTSKSSASRGPDRQHRERLCRRWPPCKPNVTGPAAGAGFPTMLQGALDTVAQTGKAAEAQALAAASGKADIVDVVTAVAESEAALETLVAVRDRVIAAYEDIMRMPI